MAEATSTTADSKARGSAEPLFKRAAGIDPGVLAAGAAVAGAIAAVLIPRSAMEIRLLAPIGKYARSGARSLGTEMRLALSAELAAVPVVGQMAVEQIDRVIDSVIPAAAADIEDTGRKDTPVD